MRSSLRISRSLSGRLVDLDEDPDTEHLSSDVRCNTCRSAHAG
jgi:hypothetical protein